MGDGVPRECRYHSVAVGRRARLHAFGARAALGLLFLLNGLAGANAQSGAKGGMVPELTQKEFEAKSIEAKRSKRLDWQTPVVSGARGAAGSKPLFVLTAVEAAGATVFSADEIAASYRPLLGKTVSEQDLLRMVESITERYHVRGFTLSRAILVPQDVNNGRVRVSVLEGRIESIDLRGEGAERFGARRLLAPLLQQRPLDLAILERQLLLVNDTPGVRVRDVSIEEIGKATGRFRLVVHLETWRLWAGFDLDNRGSPAIGPLQAFSSTAFNSFALGGETLVVNLATTPDVTSELRFGGIVLDVPIGSHGARFGLTASYSDIRPDDERRASHGRIQTEYYALSGTIVSFRARDASLWLTALAGMRNADETSSLGTIYSDRIRFMGLNAAYQARTETGSTHVTLGLRHGFDGLGASESGDALLSRTDASGESSKVFLTATQLQRLSAQWSLLFAGTAQLTSAPLLASEEFYLGGPLFGRAFRGGNVSGDSGWAGLAELRFDKPFEGALLKGYQLYAFVDSGMVWDRGKEDRGSLTSLGGGVRLSFQDGLRAGLEVAAPAGNYPASSSRGGLSFFFTLSHALRSCSDNTVLLCPSP